MSRFRLRPTPAQETALLRHCADARYVWNLCVEQESRWRRGRGWVPGWAERCRQLSAARVAQRFDTIRIENLNIRGMTRSAKGTTESPGRNVAQKTGLNRAISKSAWGMLARRLEDKAPGRVERVSFTSQRCSACGHVARESRESQALFRWVACGYMLNADVNAAMNIAAGHAVKARGGDGGSRPANREPQPELLPAR
jgi:putative transposase